MWSFTQEENFHFFGETYDFIKCLLDFYFLCIMYIVRIWNWYLVTLGVGAYAFYYIRRVAKLPVLVSDKDSPFTVFLQKNMKSLDRKYWPTFWCIESRAQTIFASILRSNVIPRINYRREILTLKDGGEVALDWFDENCEKCAPCIIILPGLTGDSQDEYVKCLAMAANVSDMRTVVFNYRGQGGIEIKTRRLYCASSFEDLSEVVRHVRKTLPGCKLGATGVSMGGLILGNYLARNSREAREHLSAAQLISTPLDVHKCTESIEKPILNALLGRHLKKGLYRTLEKCEVYKDSDVDMESLSACKTIKAFDALFTCKQFGYDHVDDYYSDASLNHKLHEISVPLLILTAADDPFQPFEALPLKAAKKCTHVAIVVTARGGHIGFLEGFWPSKRDQYMSRMFVEFFKNALFDKENDFERTSKLLLENFHAKHNLPNTSDFT